MFTANFIYNNTYFDISGDMHDKFEKNGKAIILRSILKGCNRATGNLKSKQVTSLLFNIPYLISLVELKIVQQYCLHNL